STCRSIPGPLPGRNEGSRPIRKAVGVGFSLRKSRNYTFRKSVGPGFSLRKSRNLKVAATLYWDRPSLTRRRHVPPLDGPVIAPRGQRLAVWAEGDGPGRVGVPLENREVPTGGHAPELDGLVAAPRGQGLAVRAERHRQDPGGVSRKRGGV